MIRVELVKPLGDYEAGEHIVVDSNSARALIDRGDAKKVKVVEPEPVESGAARARELQAAAEPETETVVVEAAPASAPARTEGKK